MALNANRRVTINDIAAAAGVSRTTVSRYINGQTHLMSEETRSRLKTVIQLLDYRPSDIARNLRRRTTKMIGVIIADITSPFSSAIIVGIEETLERNGYTPLFVNCSEDPHQEERFLQSFLARGIDGFIVNTPSTSNKHLISIACQGTPVILCDRNVRDYDFDLVSFDNRMLMDQVVRHLHRAGFSRPALFVEPYEQNSTRRYRRKWFLRSMEEVYGRDASGDVYTIHTGEQDDVIPQLQQFIATLSPGETPAIFCANTVTTQRLYHAMRNLNLRIPEDMGLCGTEDWNWDQGMNWPVYMDPGITTSTLASRELGKRAAELLLQRITSPELPPQRIYLPVEMVVRASTQRTGRPADSARVCF